MLDASETCGDVLVHASYIRTNHRLGLVMSSEAEQQWVWHGKQSLHIRSMFSAVESYCSWKQAEHRLHTKNYVLLFHIKEEDANCIDKDAKTAKSSTCYSFLTSKIRLKYTSTRKKAIGEKPL